MGTARPAAHGAQRPAECGRVDGAGRGAALGPDALSVEAGVITLSLHTVKHAIVA